MKTCVLMILAVGELLAGQSGSETTTDAAKMLEGVWTATSVVRNRNELPAEKLKDLQTTFRDGKFAIQQGGKTFSKGTFQLDPNITPRAIDLKWTGDDGIERTTLAIYELLDDTLKICGAQPGEARPSEFAATDGSGHTLTIFRRAKP